MQSRGSLDLYTKAGQLKQDTDPAHLGPTVSSMTGGELRSSTLVLVSDWPGGEALLRGGRGAPDRNASEMPGSTAEIKRPVTTLLHRLAMVLLLWWVYEELLREGAASVVQREMHD